MSLLDIRPLRAALAALLMLASPALAGPGHGDALSVHIEPGLALDAGQIRAVIAAELGTSVLDAGTDRAGADLGVVDIRRHDAKRVAISHRRSDGTLLVRVVALPRLPADQLAVIAFVTGNLVRDQLADLGASDPSATAVPVAAGAGSDAAAPTGAGSIDAAPPAAPVAASPVAAATPTVVVPPSSMPVAAPLSPTAATAETAEVTVPLSIGLVPPLSSDRLFASRVRVRGALNVIIGASSSIDGVSISGVADLSANVRGLQIGGAATLARDTNGIQIAGAASVARTLRGAQLAGAVAVAQDTVGVQIAGAAAAARDVRGIQIGGAGTAARDMHGIQIGGAGTAARDIRGIQVAGAAAVARQLTGLELAGGAAIAGQVEGAQIASLNIAGTLRGIQLGAINVARDAHGLQLGAINIADHSDGAQIGALNFVRHGRTDVDAWAETTGLAALALRHGGRYVHNIYAIGFTPDGGETPLVGLGLGVHRPLGGTTLDLDGMAWQTHFFTEGVGLLAQARATLAFDVGPVAAFVAAAYNVSVEDRDDERPLRTVLARTVGEPMSSVDVALWPSLAVGVRGHLGAMR